MANELEKVLENEGAVKAAAKAPTLEAAKTAIGDCGVKVEDDKAIEKLGQVFAKAAEVAEKGKELTATDLDVVTGGVINKEKLKKYAGYITGAVGITGTVGIIGKIWWDKLHPASDPAQFDATAGVRAKRAAKAAHRADIAGTVENFGELFEEK